MRCELHEPAKRRDRRVGVSAIVLGGAKVGKRQRARRVVELLCQRRGEHAPQQVRGHLEFEILIGTDGARHHVARAAGLRLQRRGEQQGQHCKSDLHRVTTVSVMSVSRTLPPAGTTTHALCVWNPSRANSR